MARKIYHVEIKTADKDRHHYFGSQAAIFEWLGRDDLGISYKSLRAIHNFADGPYENRKCIIRMGELKTKEGNRGRKPKYLNEYDY